MSNSTESPISISIKSSSGALVTVRADDGAGLDALIASSLAAIESAVKELEGVVKSANPGLPPHSPQVAHALASLGATPVVEDVPPFDSAPSIGGGRVCKHGKMTALQGPSKQGGVYKGYFCPTAQGAMDKCKTIYVQKHDPEWNTFVPDRIK